MGSKSVVSVWYVADCPEVREAVLTSDYVRNETLKRLCSIPSYPFKTLYWKNKYYDAIKAKVIKEVENNAGISFS